MGAIKIFYLQEYINFYLFLHTFIIPSRVKLGTGDLHTMLFSSCELRENQRKEGHTFLIGVHEIISASAQ